MQSLSLKFTPCKETNDLIYKQISEIDVKIHMIED